NPACASRTAAKPCVILSAIRSSRSPVLPHTVPASLTRDRVPADGIIPLGGSAVKRVDRNSKALFADPLEPPSTRATPRRHCTVGARRANIAGGTGTAAGARQSQLA